MYNEMGYAASRAARKTDDNLIRTAYNDAMREWQDWVQETIGAPFGLARIGPRRARMNNDEWNSNEKIRLAEVREKAAKESEAQAEIQKKAAQESEAQLAKTIVYIQRLEALIKEKEREIEFESQKQTQVYTEKFMDLVKQKAQIATLAEENEKRASEVTAVLSSLQPEIRSILIERHEFLQQFAGEESTIEESTNKPS